MIAFAFGVHESQDGESSASFSFEQFQTEQDKLYDELDDIMSTPKEDRLQAILGIINKIYITSGIEKKGERSWITQELRTLLIS